MTIQTTPLNPEQRRSLQQWLGGSASKILRQVVRAEIALQKSVIIEKSVEALRDAQYAADAKEAAQKVQFYEDFLTLLGKLELGHNPDQPSEEYEYKTVTIISDEPPLTPKNHA